MALFIKWQGFKPSSRLVVKQGSTTVYNDDEDEDEEEHERGKAVQESGEGEPGAGGGRAATHSVALHSAGRLQLLAGRLKNTSHSLQLTTSDLSQSSRHVIHCNTNVVRGVQRRSPEEAGGATRQRALQEPGEGALASCDI